MDNLFLLLFFVSIIALVVGLVSPSAFTRFLKERATRKGAAKIFGVSTIVFFILFAITTDNNSTKQPSEQSPVVQQQEQQNETTEQPQQKQITYEILERWSIPNGGEGKKVLISKDYINDTDMTALGNKLRQDVSSDRNAFIQVYTDRQAAALRDKVLADNATQAENDLYDQNYVGQYNKNGNTGLHQFNIFFDGVMGTNQKTISY